MSLLLVTLFLSGCGRDAFQRPCTTSTDCIGSNVCVEGACVPGDGTTEDMGRDQGPSKDGGPDMPDDGRPDMPVVCVEDSQCIPPPNLGCVVPSCLNNVCEFPQKACPENTTIDPGSCQCIPDVDPNACETRADCDDGYVCTDGMCSACRGDEDCAANERCGRFAGNPDNVCLPRPECLVDRDCQDNEICLGGRCSFSPECERNEQCRDGFECVGNRCFEKICRGPEDCADDEVCDAGECKKIETQIATCFIANSDFTFAPGDSVPLSGFALDADGNGIAATFSWASSDPSIVSVQGNNAVAANKAGVVGITARATTSAGTIACERRLTVTNIGPVMVNNLRVLVVDAESGSAVPMAQVIARRPNGTAGATVTTNAAGVASLPVAPGVYDVTVISNEYNYITVQGLRGRDIRVPLLKKEGTSSVGGFSGKFDLSQITTRGDIELGLAGASLSGGLINFELSRLLGEPFVEDVSVPQLGDFDVALPGGLVALGQVFGFNLDIKTNYFVSSSGGAKLTWGLGGKVSALSLLNLFQGGISTDLGEVLTLILPLFNRFDHGMKPAVLNARPRVVDTVDIDGDGDTSELVPDYLNFPVIDLKPNVPQRLITSVSVSNLPTLGDGRANAAIIIGGALQSSAGFVPLGISATSDADGDGAPDTQRLTMSPPYGSLTGSRYALLSVAFRTSDFSTFQGSFSFPDDFSIALWNGQSIPNAVQFGTYPDRSRAQVNEQTRRIRVRAAAGPVYRVRFVGRERSWDVWTQGPNGNMGSFTHGITIPRLPPAVDDLFILSEKTTIDAIRTQTPLDTLVSPSGLSLYDVGLVSTGYNRTRVR